MGLPFAEEVGCYWKTSQSSADTWVDKTEALIEAYGGEVLTRAVGRQNGREAILLEFRFDDDRFRLVWPALGSKYLGHDEKPSFRNASRRQAATMLYHDVKARGVRFKLAGARAAFFEYLALPDGRVVGELAAPDLLAAMPKLLVTGDLGAGDP